MYTKLTAKLADEALQRSKPQASLCQTRCSASLARCDVAADVQFGVARHSPYIRRPSITAWSLTASMCLSVTSALAEKRNLVRCGSYSSATHPPGLRYKIGFGPAERSWKVSATRDS